MAGLLVPLSVVVVAHDVDVVEVLVHLGDVIRDVDGGGGGADGRGQEEIVFVEALTQLADQFDEVLLVLRGASSLGCKENTILLYLKVFVQSQAINIHIPMLFVNMRYVRFVMEEAS